MTPGQHLHALWIAHFNGAGWADAPAWDDFGPDAQAQWEFNAAALAPNMRLALAAPRLAQATRQLLAEVHDRERNDEIADAVEFAELVLASLPAPR